MESFTEEENQVLDRVIGSRRTVRSFKEEAPPKATIEKVLLAGLNAPYAQISVSREDFRRFIVIPKESKVTPKAADLIKRQCQIAAEELARKMEQNSFQELRGERYLGALRSSGAQGPPNLGKAPYYVVVAEQRGVPDVATHSLAHCLENMWLKATALGLAFQLLSVTERMAEDKEFCDLIGIQFGEYALDGCLMGYPGTTPTPPKRPDLHSVTTWL